MFTEYLSSAKHWASLVTQMIKNLPAIQETQVQSVGQKDSLEEGIATHFSILAWRIHRVHRVTKSQT